MNKKIRILQKNWYLIRLWTKYNVQAKYVNTKLGIFWIILQPLGLTLIYTIVFTNLIFRRPRGDVPFIIFFLAGMIIWQFISSSIMSSSTLIVRNLRLFGQIKFSREVLIVINLFENLVDFCATFLIFIGLSIFYGFSPNSTYIYLPIIFLVILLFTLGSMFFVSTLSVFIRDLPALISLILRFLFYFSGVIFSIDMLPEEVGKYLIINPLLVMVETFRDIVIYSKAPEPITMLIMLFISVLVLILGYLFFKSREGTFVDYE